MAHDGRLPDAKAKLCREDKEAMRWVLIQLTIAEGGGAIPSCRELTRRISDYDPRLVCSHRTVLDDREFVRESHLRFVGQLLR